MKFIVFIIISIIALSIISIEGYALYKNIDGKALGICLTALGGFVGYAFHWLKNLEREKNKN